METAIFYVTLDIDDAYSHVSMNLHQGESGRKISASFSQSSKPYPVSEDCHAVFAGTVPDGQVFFNDCVIENECVICELPAQITSLFGLVKAEIRLYGDKGRLIASPAFTINVVESAMEDGALLERIEATALTELIAQAKEAVAECKSSVIDEVELSYQENGGEASAHAQFEENEDGRTLQFHFSNLKGEVGEQGPKGDKGDKGDRGETGDIGPAGKDGADCTPLALGAYVTPTAAGDIASFDDGADGIPVKSLVVDIEPVQNLIGYDSPWPPGGGKNKIPFPYSDTTKTMNGLTVTINNDGSITVNGSSTANVYINLATGSNKISLSDGTYTVSGTPGNADVQLSVTENDAWIGNAIYTPFTFEASADAGYNIYYTIPSGVTLNNVKLYPQLEEGSTATAYEPYSNICPISGWTGASVTRTGKNLVNIPNFENTSAATIDESTRSIFDAFPYEANTQYTFQCDCVVDPSRAFGMYIGYGDGTREYKWFSRFGAANKSVTSRPNATVSFAYFAYDNTQTVSLSNFMMEEGSTATDYEPYQGDTYDISFPDEAGTVYGGRLDVTTGLLTVDRAKLTLNTANMVGENEYPGWWSDELGNIITTPINDTIQAQVNIGTSVGVNTIITEGANIFLPSNVYGKSRSEWQALALDVQTLLPYTTPVTYQLTPTEVNTLLGVNNICADTGGVEVSFRADPTKIYEKVMNAMLTMTSGLYMTDE